MIRLTIVTRPKSGAAIGQVSNVTAGKVMDDFTEIANLDAFLSNIIWFLFIKFINHGGCRINTNNNLLNLKTLPQKRGKNNISQRWGMVKSNSKYYI